MKNTFHIPQCPGEFLQDEACLLTQRLVQLALTYKHLHHTTQSLNRDDESFEEVRALLRGSRECIAEQMVIQLLQFSGHWEYGSREE